MFFIEITQRILGKREQNGISLSIMLTFDKGKVEIGIFQVAVHLRKYRGDFLFPIFGFSYFYPQPVYLQAYLPLLLRSTIGHPHP